MKLHTLTYARLKELFKGKPAIKEAIGDTLANDHQFISRADLLSLIPTIADVGGLDDDQLKTITHTIEALPEECYIHIDDYIH